MDSSTGVGAFFRGIPISAAEHVIGVCKCWGCVSRLAKGTKSAIV
jgi:hypothetical protein